MIEIKRTVFASLSSANQMNKLSLVGIRGPSLETSKFSLYFSGSCIPTNESLFIGIKRPIYIGQRIYQTGGSTTLHHLSSVFLSGS